MGIDDIFIVLVLVAGFVLSGLQKLAERSKAKRRMMEEERTTGNRGNADDTIRTAQRREPARRAQSPQTAPPGIEDVIRRLMGEEQGPQIEGPDVPSAEMEEGDWRPVPPPPIRRAPPQPQRAPATPPRQMTQPPRRQAQMPQRPVPPPQSARPVRQRPARTPNEMVAQPRRRLPEEFTPEELEQRENERRWREEMERRKKQQAAQQTQQAQQQKDLPRPRARIMPSRRRVFHSASEVRRAIILSEVLGPPRSMRDIEERA